MSDKCDELKAKKRLKYGMDDNTKINVLDFGGCSTQCDCGCSIRLGMNRNALKKLTMLMISVGFKFEEINGEWIGTIRDYIDEKPNVIPSNLKRRKKEDGK